MSTNAPPLPPDIMALLHAERDATPPSHEARDRVRDRVHASVGLAATTVAGVSLAVLRSSGKMVAVGKTSMFAGAAVKLVLAIVVGSIGTSAYFAWHAHKTPSQLAPALTPADRESGHTMDPLVDPIPAVIPTVAVPMPSLSSRHHANDDPSHLREERVLLERAGAALSAGDTAGALAAVEQHAHRFPSGQLSEDRECLRIRALAASGDVDGTKRGAAAFALRYPNSLFQPSVCATP